MKESRTRPSLSRRKSLSFGFIFTLLAPCIFAQSTGELESVTPPSQNRTPGYDKVPSQKYDQVPKANTYTIPPHKNTQQIKGGGTEGTQLARPNQKGTASPKGYDKVPPSGYDVSPQGGQKNNTYTIPPHKNTQQIKGGGTEGTQLVRPNQKGTASPKGYEKVPPSGYDVSPQGGQKNNTYTIPPHKNTQQIKGGGTEGTQLVRPGGSKNQYQQVPGQPYKPVPSNQSGQYKTIPVKPPGTSTGQYQQVPGKQYQQVPTPGQTGQYKTLPKSPYAEPPTGKNAAKKPQGTPVNKSPANGSTPPKIGQSAAPNSTGTQKVPTIAKKKAPATSTSKADKSKSKAKKKFKK